MSRIILSLTCHLSLTDAVMRLFSICSLITFDLVLYVNSADGGEQPEDKKKIAHPDEYPEK